MTKKIYIDFQGGAHGNYLEFVCNKFLAGIKTLKDFPFNCYHTSEHKQYLEDPIFVANHYTTYKIPLENETVIFIHIEYDDLLPLQCISLLRAGDLNIEPEKLEFNTYQKLNNKHYQSVLDNIISNFFNINHIITAYENIADPSWPKITSLEDYKNLPIDIREECQNVHNFVAYQFDEDHPNCPRHILHEFFQLGFENPSQAGFIVAQKDNIHKNCNVYKFPFSSFYNLQEFSKQLSKIAMLLDMKFDPFNQKFINLHNKFLSTQPYKNSKIECDQLVDLMLKNPNMPRPKLDVIKEAYIDAKLKAYK